MDSDVESIIEDRLEPDLERVLEPDQQEFEDHQSDNDDRHSEAEEARVRVDPSAEKKSKVVRNPRLTLNPARLTGPRGIQTIEDVFKDFKFSGKGYEKEDLAMVMKKLEHWAHRLYPKFQFDDCLDKIAALGKKKEVSTHIRKIRLDMLCTDTEINDDNRNEDMEDIENAPVMDEFDQLLNEQIALARSTPASAKFTATRTVEETPIVQENTFVNLESTTERNIVDISIEQRERMMKNRLLAEQRRLARMKAAMEENNTSVTENEIHEHSEVL